MGDPRRLRMYQMLDLAYREDATSRWFARFIVALISLNVAANIAESVPEAAQRYATWFHLLEVFSVGVFTIEYVLRVESIVEGPDARFRAPLRGRLLFLVSPLAIADFLAIAPFFVSAFIDVDLRILRVLRLLRVFKLARRFTALSILLDVIRMERQAFGAAYFIVVIGLLLAASGVWLFEHNAQPEALGSIPAALWWSVTTLTTVGYGDVTPITIGGKIFGTFVMLLGVGLVAVPTGILATGFALELRKRREGYDVELSGALEDGVIDESERAHLEMIREALGLSRDEADSLESSPLRRLLFPARESPHCPHCGEPLDRSPPDGSLR